MASDAPQRGVVGRAKSTQMFDLQRWQPSTEAAQFVEHFWSVRWDLRGQPPFDSAVITFPSMHITREWGDDDARHGHRLPNTLIQGVVEEVFHTTLSRWGTVVGARFRPGGFAARFGRDASDYTGRTVPVDDELFGEAIEFDEDRDAVSRRLDALIAQFDGPPDPVYADLTALLTGIESDQSLHRVEQVMAQSPWSARTTQRIFRRYVGVPVKWVLCRYRLQHAALEIETQPDADLADLAVRHGWYDQAHFTNDFRALLGCTPGDYVANFGPTERT